LAARDIPGNAGQRFSAVMTGLDPAIHGLQAWMPGTRPGMTGQE